ncbi:response regulator transcription factor [Photobacterium swingsii]|uniref:response regulator transcription factor n=1 Tax=Photobacterium swingsii TaxID=680026 RepID=UPI0040684138
MTAIKNTSNTATDNTVLHSNASKPRSKSIAPSTVERGQILIVEDDNDLAELVAIHLSLQGHHTRRAASLAQAQLHLAHHHYDLVILDRGLDDGDGITLCQSLRNKQNWLPILMLTARGSEIDKVAGLEAGADDYLTKPFSVLEFQARVRTILRRRTHDQANHHQAEDNNKATATLALGGLVINPELHHVEINHHAVQLTATEFTLLYFLAQKPGRVYSKEELLQQVWQTDFSGYQHTVCSTVNRLRTKLENANPNHPFIRTVWGVGYKFESA